MLKKCLSLLLAAQLLLPAAAPAAAYAKAANDENLALPELGDASSSRFSADQEYELGRAWLKAFRSRVDISRDPLLQSYTEDLLFRLAHHSELSDKRLELVVVENQNLNAFAVPGGVIGVHNGLFLYADNEAQLAGVIGHELAHLSQRHFARSVEKQRESTLSTLAGLMAGVVLAATAGGDAGIAAIAAGQAAGLQSQLRYSREHEREADRIGMKTLAKADMDPNAIPAMFENMNKQLRYSRQRPPEFLLTHPLTENRINDGRNRARQYQRKVYTDNLNFQLMKTRVTLHFADNPSALLKQWQHQQQDNPSEALRYGIALTLARLGRWDEAQAQLAPLLRDDPHRIAYVAASADILSGRGEHAKAAKLLRGNLALSPGNHPLTMQLAAVLQASNRAHEAEELLLAHAKRRPTDPAVWYQLAELQGLAGNILGVHQARAEYFILNGYLDSAEKQLHYAWPLASSDHITQRRIKQRLRDIQALRDTLKKF